jgi:mRNA export factor
MRSLSGLPLSSPSSIVTVSSSVKVLPDLGLVATASWDKSVRLWDTRQPNPAATLPLTDRAFCMDAGGPGMVVCTGDRKIHVFDLTAGLPPL